MEKEWDLCSGRDCRGRELHARLPAGAAKTGMYIRLVGGVFMTVERVAYCAGPADGQPLCAAAELLQPVWRRKG